MNLDNAMCISLWQPWASAIALGLKKYETRSWSTRHRGPLLIHAAKRWKQEQADFWISSASKLRYMNVDPVAVKNYDNLDELAPPLGCIVAVAELTGCLFTGSNLLRESMPELELLFGDFGPDRFMWRLERVIRLREPVPCAGHQGPWRPSAEVLAAVRSQMTEESCS